LLYKLMNFYEFHNNFMLKFISKPHLKISKDTYLIVSFLP